MFQSAQLYRNTWDTTLLTVNIIEKSINYNSMGLYPSSAVSLSFMSSVLERGCRNELIVTSFLNTTREVIAITTR